MLGPILNRPFLIIGAAVVAASLSWGWWQGLRAERAEAAAQIAERRAESAEQAVIALETHAAEAERIASRAKTIKEEIDNAPDDCPAPDWLRDLPDRLRFDNDSPAFAH